MKNINNEEIFFLMIKDWPSVGAQVSGDSCIFIWKLPNSLSRMMRKRCILGSESLLLHFPSRSSEQSEKQEWTPNIFEGKRVCAEDTHMHIARNGQGSTDVMCNIPSAFKFSVSRLPHWAQAKVSDTITDEGTDVLKEESIHSSESRWVEVSTIDCHLSIALAVHCRFTISVCELH